MGLAEKSKRGGLRVKLARSRIMQVVTTRSEVPDWGRLSNKRYSDFVRMAKFEKYASAATLALLAVSAYPGNPMKKRRQRRFLRSLRFSGFLYSLCGGFHDRQFILVHCV